MSIKQIDYKIESCDTCPFFTLKWEQPKYYIAKDNSTIPVIANYVCDHPKVPIPQLPNTILIEGKEVDTRGHISTWKMPNVKGTPIPDFCPLNDREDPGVKVGVTAIAVRNKKVLLGLRGHGCETAKNEWAYPGGRIDFGEYPLTAISREITEETAMTVHTDSLEFLQWVNEFFPEENKHYISLVFLAKDLHGDPHITEPDKCKEWKWFDPNDIPDNTFWPARENIQKYKNRIIYD